MSDDTQPRPFNVGHHSYSTQVIVETVTLRDQFAMAALTSLLSSPSSIGEGTPALAAKLAYRFADSMLEARKEKK